ncbi:MAG: biotin/lipoyl-binding protein [Magnetococcales bacterium]|nr:biotin/lipoyl-binding protein [Magnetococcales bacterium]
MAGNLMEALPLPPLREDLILFPGPLAADGAPSWTLHDPARHQFHRVDRAAFEILARWSLGNPEEILACLTQETTLRLSRQDIEAVARFLSTHQLSRSITPQDTARLVLRAEKSRHQWTTWLLHHYLYFRIPLVRPDAFLAAALPWVSFLYSRQTFYFMSGAFVIGAILLLRQWELFVHSLLLTLTWEGMIWYGITLSVVKVIHELGHALTARRHGCRVPTMGIAFLVLWPVLFTDTTEAWKLADPKKRFAVAAAGVTAEMMVAILALLAWNLLPDGMGRGMAFLLSTTTFFSTILINISPFLRFDGYYLLADHLDIHNLHQRAGALARWWLREQLFRPGEPPPESFPWGRRIGLILFAFATWLYRLVLFLGIAVFVYHFFIKAVGIFLFGVEIVWFILMPIGQELGVWWMRRHEFMRGGRARIWAGVGMIALLILFVPWNTRITAPAMLHGQGHAALFASSPGRLKALKVAEGQTVAAGELLFELENPDLDHRRRQNAKRRQMLEWEWAGVGVDPLLLGRSQVLHQELETAITEGVGLEQEAARNRITAPFSGRVVDLTPDLQPGQWLSNRERLGGVLAIGPPVMHAYLTEVDLARVVQGQSARFHPDNPDASAIDCLVTTLDKSNVRHLADPLLAASHGGEIPVRDIHDQRLPEQALYRITLEGIDQDATILVQQRGTLVMSGPARSLADRVARSMLAVLIRESGF